MKHIFFIFLLSVCINIFSQDSLYQARSKTFATYPQEQLYLQTSKDIYESGEDLWFKVYHLDAYSFGRSTASRTLYLEMLNDKDSIVWQEKYPVKEGICSGHVYVDEKLIDGDYYLRACTRNSCYNDTLRSICHRKIRIVKHISNVISTTNSSVEPADSIRFGFYPEGGYLIHGLPCRIAFKGTNGHGQPVSVEGSLYKNDTLLTSFKSFHDGMGSIMLIPDKQGKYRVKLKNGKQYCLPEIQEQGITLQFIRQTEETIDFYILKSDDLPTQKIYLTGQLRGVYSCMAHSVVKDRLKISVPLKEFPYQGIAEFTLYNDEMKPLAERLVYVHPTKKLYISAATDKPIYKLRDKAAIHIVVKDEQGNPVPNVDLGVSVFDGEYANPGCPMNILSYNYLVSQLRGEVYNAAYYFDDSNADRVRALDFLLLTQGWRRYVWNSHAASDYCGKPFLEEGIKGKQIIPGKRKAKKVKGISQLIKVFTPDEKSHFLAIDSLGKFEIPTEALMDMSGSYLYLKPMLKKEYDPRLEINDSFTELDSLCKLKPIPYLGNLLLKDTHLDKEAFLDKERTVLLDEVLISKKSKGRAFRDKFMGRLDSLAQIDLGPWVCEHGYLENYKPGYTHFHDPAYWPRPKFTKRIKPVIGKSYHLFKPQFLFEDRGVIHFKTVDSQEVIYQGPCYSEEELLRMNGIWRAKSYYGTREFYQQDEVDMQSSIPDVRNTLLWQPSVITDSNGEATVHFYCSDINSKFIYRIEGMDGMRLLGSTQAEFKVYREGE